MAETLEHGQIVTKTVTVIREDNENGVRQTLTTNRVETVQSESPSLRTVQRPMLSHSKDGFSDSVSGSASRMKNDVQRKLDPSEDESERRGFTARLMQCFCCKKNGAEHYNSNTVRSPSPKSKLGPDEEDEDHEFLRDSLKWHNHYRGLHGVTPLKLSSEVIRGH